MFYTEIQEGRQKWWRNNFWEKPSVDCKNLGGGGQTLCQNWSILQFLEIHFWQKSPVDPGGKKILWNQSNLLCFWDKCVFCFTWKIKMAEENGIFGFCIFHQGDRQKCQINYFGEKSMLGWTDTSRVKNVIEIALAYSVSEINMSYAEIQDGCQKWWENDYGTKTSVDSADAMFVKNFVKIALVLSISKINVILHFMKKLKMAAKSGKRRNQRNSPVDSADIPVWQKFWLYHSISLRFQDKHILRRNSRNQNR